MKKIIIGIIIGFVLSYASSAYGTNIKNMVGEKVQGLFPVKVDGMNLETPALVIDGVGYASIKEIGKKFGFTTKFNKKEGIFLQSVEPVIEREGNITTIRIGERTFQLMDQMIK